MAFGVLDWCVASPEPGLFVEVEGPSTPAQASCSSRDQSSPASPASPLADSEGGDVEQLTEEELRPWLEAARRFEMNSDFDVREAVEEEGGDLDLGELMAVMKSESGGKRTIQALGDKILLSKLLGNLGVPQMPMLFETYSEVDERQVEEFVAALEQQESDLGNASRSQGSAYDVVVKPTHLSNGTGALVLSKDTWKSNGYDARKLAEHMETYLDQQAADSESEALRSLVPGFIAQPRYRSCLEFGHPLEMRVVTLWGKARVGVWWWGRASDKSTGKPHRSTWLTRKPRAPGELSEADDWQVVHRHPGGNAGFQAALKLFQEAMPLMASAAEAVASSVGAPFLRSDFFVGSDRWGIRLNEVAYGSGVDYRRPPRADEADPSGASASAALEDDGPAIAQILQEGYDLCRRRPPEHFLSRLGAAGASYEAQAAWWQWWEPDDSVPAMSVHEVAESGGRRLAPDVVQRMADASGSACKRMGAWECATPRGRAPPAPSTWVAPRSASASMHAVPAVASGCIPPPAGAPWLQKPAKPAEGLAPRSARAGWPSAARPGGA